MKDLLLAALKKHYSKKMAYACLNGTRQPSLSVIVEIEDNEHVPAKAWLDIKTFLRDNPTPPAEGIGSSASNEADSSVAESPVLHQDVTCVNSV